MRTRNLLRSDIVTYLLVLAVAIWGGSVWLKKHQREAEADKVSRTEMSVKVEHAKIAAHRMETTWRADGNWQDDLSAMGNSAPAYSLDVSHVLVRDHPILIFGTVDDVRAQDTHDAKIVLIENNGRYLNGLKLRFSLSSSSELAELISAQARSTSLAELDTFICVASIQSVEKIEESPSEEGDTGDYFLAHGVLNAMYATHVFDMNPKEVTAE